MNSEKIIKILFPLSLFLFILNGIYYLTFDASSSCSQENISSHSQQVRPDHVKIKIPLHLYFPLNEGGAKREDTPIDLYLLQENRGPILIISQAYIQSQQNIGGEEVKDWVIEIPKLDLPKIIKFTGQFPLLAFPASAKSSLLSSPLSSPTTKELSHDYEMAF